MLVTLFPIVTLLNESQPKNAHPSIFSPEMITTSFNTDFGILDIAMVGIVAFSIGQPENADLPMLVTLFPIVTLVNEVHSQNAPSPILVTLFGIVILVNESQ